MNQRLQTIYDRLISKKYRDFRCEFDVKSDMSEKNFALRAAKRLYKLTECEKVNLFKGDKFGFMRTVKSIPELNSLEEKDAICRDNIHFFVVNNISCDYEDILKFGLEHRLNQIRQKKTGESDSERLCELEAMELSIMAVYNLAEKYKSAAKENNPELYSALCNVPKNRPKNFYEAAVFLRIINFSLWLNDNRHNTLGRFDQYMYPYFREDLDSGRLSLEEALDIILELFMSLNFDTDLYPGVQQGDNGQSLVLGGCDQNGTWAYNELSDLCLKASLELNVIDPKINLRISKDTPDEVYYLGTLLTKQGLGFPQYNNDDIVIPALCELGYDLYDARNYVVAACWEFIIPACGMEVVNVGALNFPYVINKTIFESLSSCQSMDEFILAVQKNITLELVKIVNLPKPFYFEPSPLMSVYMKGCIENVKDISLGAKYNGFGVHGSGLSVASDSLAAIEKNVFEEKSLEKERLVESLRNDFEDENIRKKLLASPKTGNNDDYADKYLVMLMDYFSQECKKLKNVRGGVVRAGTGTAMHYIWDAEKIGATADGRKASESFGANYSPSLTSHNDGVLSVIKSFTKPKLKKCCNGGPLTLEFHDTVFKNDEGIKKVAALIKTYFGLGGHQLQLNSVNRDKLMDAQKHPEKYPNLIVRVWGWSGYFNELDIEYQNHIIKRTEFSI